MKVSLHETAGRNTAVDNGYDIPEFTDWVYPDVKVDETQMLSATAATAGDNE